jgi:hypothetical protein
MEKLGSRLNPSRRPIYKYKHNQPDKLLILSTYSIRPSVRAYLARNKTKAALWITRSITPASHTALLAPVAAPLAQHNNREWYCTVLPPADT